MLFFSSCSDDVLDVDLSEKMEVIVHGFVYDKVTNEPVEGAEISCGFGDFKTDENGFYEIDNLPMGDYRLIITADGYMSVIEEVNSELNEEEFQGESLVDVIESPMVKRTGSLSTQLISIKNEITSVYANLPYTIYFDSRFVTNFIKGTTDSDGNITLVDTLPLDFIQISIDTIVGDFRYYLYTYISEPGKESKQYTVSVYDAGSTVFYVTGSSIFDDEGDLVDDFDVDEDITIEFNAAIDASTVKAGMSYYSGGSGEVFTDISVTGNVLTINPVYSLAKGATYKVWFEVESTDGEEIDDSYYFSTVGSGDLYVTFANTYDENGEAHDAFSTSSDIEIEFSLDIDATEYSVELVKNNSIQVLHTVSVSGNSMTIMPEGSVLEEGTSYYVKLTVQSATDEDLTLTKTLYFTTIGDKITSLSTPTWKELLTPSLVSETSDYITFEIYVDENTNTSDVEIYGNYSGNENSDEYVKYSGATVYQKINDAGADVAGVFGVQLSLSNFPGVDVPTDGLFADGNYFNIVLKANNGDVVSGSSSVYKIEKGDAGTSK
jgi:hypothetical protein